jgi:DNA-binding LacI/PurR family transcriptional regulator/DNA-binding transcriptional regulator YhcF (GntR family)
MESRKTASINKLLAFRLTGQESASKEIGAHVRSLIKDGTLPPGIGIPPTKVLAAAWDVFPNTVKIALDPLVKEGLMDRRRYRGSFVLDARRNIRRLGIYENFGAIPTGDRDFLVSLQIELSVLLEKQNAELKVWIDGRKSPKSLPENLVEACRKREIDGVVTSHPLKGILKSLTALPVPITALTSFRDCPQRVDFRFKDLVENSVRRLAALGVRRAAVVSSVVPDATTETINPQDVSRFYDHFRQAVADHGMETRPEWMIQPTTPKPKRGIEQFGYDATKTLWSQSSLPDGLFIFPHTTARGSLTALLELGVKIPDDLKLVAHGNIETPILTPYPVEWITSSSREIVQAMVSQIQCALDGQAAKPVWLTHRPTW